MRRLLIVLFVAMALTAKAQRDDFDGETLNPSWQYLGQPDVSKYQLKDGRLRLIGDIYEVKDDGPTSFLGLPVGDAPFTFETKLTLYDADSGDEAGICLYRSKNAYVQCCLNNYRGDHRLRVRLHFLSHRLLLADQSVGLRREVWFRVSLSENEPQYEFSYSFDGKKFNQLESVEKMLLSPALIGSSNQMLIGLFSVMGSVKYQAGYSYADFYYTDLKR